MANSVPVILDLVKCRTLADRRAAQASLHDVFERISAATPPQVSLWATVGDEFQVVYRELRDALRASALVRLLANDAFDCRFSIGVGPIRTIEQGRGGPIDDGEGWCRARRALEECAQLQFHSKPWVRTWIQLSEVDESSGKSARNTADATARNLTEQAVRAYLATRDHVISRMKAKERRITAAWLMGVPQVDIARKEKLSQPAASAVSPAPGGAALVHADHILAAKVQ